MISPVSVLCQCGYQLVVETTGTKPLKDTECPNCHTPIWFVAPLADVVGVRIMNRAWAELAKEDFTLTIVLSAMAIECELARQYGKWKGIDLSIAQNINVFQAQRNPQWAKEWREFQTTSRRLDEISKLLTCKTFDSFLSSNSDLSKVIAAEFPGISGCSSAKKFFIQELFHRRNRILHGGEVDFNELEARACFGLAAALFRIKTTMDLHRNDVLASQ